MRRPGPDRPVADLLQERRDLATAPGELEAVAGYLEGFHAADLSLLGTRALAENEAARAPRTATTSSVSAKGTAR